MLTHYALGLPILSVAHGLAGWTLAKASAWEDCLYRWHRLLVQTCPCGDCG